MRLLNRIALFISILIMAILTTGWLFLQRSLPKLDGETVVSTLTAPVSIKFDHHGVPVIKAEKRLDVVRALGFVTAQDRLFQMDLMRRKSAGRLSELFGSVTVDSDTRVRIFDFNNIAKNAFSNLPQRHKELLLAYAEGVNSYIDQAKELPFEFSLLNYTPDYWQPEDCMLIVLGMFDMLTAGAENEERMLSVMEKTLHPDIVAFLTPDTDKYTDSLYGAVPTWRPSVEIPTKELYKAITDSSDTNQVMAGIFKDMDLVAGSNAWAINGKRTVDGRAILANDMHLGISVPNIWYKAEVDYSGRRVAGVFLPGTPLIIAGSNTHLSWGGTNLLGDFLDLVTLEIDPTNDEKYKAAGDWKSFGHRKELILVKGALAKEVDIRTTIWGPVSSQKLLGNHVAIHWTALDTEIVNVGMLDLEEASSLSSAIEIVHHVGGPQINILLADDSGHIAWTIMGKIPKRIGFDGSVSRSWADGTLGWEKYVEESSIPKDIDPATGILVSANDRRLGKNYPYVIGHQFIPGYRAYRINKRIKQMSNINEKSMFELQLDTEAEFYGFYHQLALDVLTPEIIRQRPELQSIREHLLAWNGRADPNSMGFALLQTFRGQLADSIFGQFLTSCRKVDNDFHYSWLYIDTPLQAMLTRKIPMLLPESKKYISWDVFILTQLENSLQQLKSDYSITKLNDLRWGSINKAKFSHPIFGELPYLGKLLSMPEDELAGCGGCVRAVGPNFGAGERMVVSPSQLSDGILQMPIGQSAHPLSPYYADQQSFWVQGISVEFIAKDFKHQMILTPN